MSYTKTQWVNGTAPPISAENLNKIEDALESHDEDITDLRGQIDSIDDVAVTTERIADSAVTWEKLAGGVKARIANGGGGIGDQAIDLLIEILRSALFKKDQSENITLLGEALRSGNSDVIYQSGETLTIEALANAPYQSDEILTIE